MNTSQGPMLERLRAVRDFLAKFAARFGDLLQSGSLRQLDKAIADLEAHSARQGAADQTGKGGVAKLKALRTDLLEKHMRPIVSIAAVDLPRTPELSRLRVPRGNPTPEKLLQDAQAMHKTVEPFAQTFIDAGLPADFLAQLDAAAEAVAEFAVARKGNTGGQKAATQGLRDMIAIGNRVITALDALVKKALDSGNPDDKNLRDEWAAVKTVRKTPTRSAAATQPVPIPPVTPPPVATTATSTPTTGAAA